MTPEEKSQHVLKKLFRNGLGVSADSIKKYQGNGLGTFGIMYPELKELLKTEKTDNNVAKNLLKRNTREARISGYILSEPGKLSFRELKTWQEFAITGELKNIFARHTVSRYPEFIDQLDNIMQFVSIDVVLKAIIQHYRQYKKAPSPDLCFYVLEIWVNQANPLFTDGENFAVLVYQHHKGYREQWKINLLELTKLKPEYKPDILSWMYDLKYVE